MTNITTESDDLSVDASPTKEFFVDTITRDIPLDKAISDLIDNCIDGAKRLRDNNDDNGNTTAGRYAGLYVDVTVGPQEFRIADNCGGIDIETARNYAFKFGRPKGFRKTRNSVGQFGVGMKRALFKMADDFEISTADAVNSYKILVNVPEWLAHDVWELKISDLKSNTDHHAEPGTTIRCWNLAPGVADLFSQGYFLRNLRQQIAVTQERFMRNGLTIRLNNEAIITTDWQLQRGEGIEPLYQRYSDPPDGEPQILTRLYAGIGTPSQTRAGWYVFCNGRCILEADQSNVTGWGEIAGGEGVNIPRYHNQFSRFRGYAFLDCEDAEKLPWNTTKTALDLEDPAYRILRGRLLNATRPIIDFLNALDREKDLEPEDRQLERTLKAAPMVKIADLQERAQFHYTPSIQRGPPLRTISFKKPEPEITELQQRFEVTSYRDVGIKAFEYAYERLVGEDEL